MKKTFTLSRKSGARSLLLRNLATSVVLYEKVHTTHAKAKAVRPLVERLITYARQGTLTARRRIASHLLDPNAVRKLMEDASTRLDNRSSGFVRLTKTLNRRGDGSEMAYIELLFGTPAEVKPSKAVSRTKKESASASPEATATTEDKE